MGSPMVDSRWELTPSVRFPWLGVSPGEARWWPIHDARNSPTSVLLVRHNERRSMGSPWSTFGGSANPASGFPNWVLLRLWQDEPRWHYHRIPPYQSVPNRFQLYQPTWTKPANQLVPWPMVEAIDHGMRGRCLTSSAPDLRPARFSLGQREPDRFTGRRYPPTDRHTSTLGPLDPAMAEAPPRTEYVKYRWPGPTWGITDQPVYSALWWSRGWGANAQISLRASLPKRPRLDRERLNERLDEIFGWTRRPRGIGLR